MAARLWQPSEDQRRILLDENISHTRAAELCAVSEGTIRRHRREWGFVGPVNVGRRPRQPPVPMPEPLGLAPALEITDGRDVLVAGDWHVPRHNKDAVEALLEVAKKERVTTLVLNGDLLDEEVFFRAGDERRPTMTAFRTECEVAERLIDSLAGQFTSLYWTSGNHEQRLYRLTKGEIDMLFLRRIIGGKHEESLTVTDRDWLVIRYGERPQDTWRITHGQGGSVMLPTSAAVAKAEAYNCNVIQGHDHLFGLRQTRNGLLLGVDHGCMADASLVSYRELSTRTYPSWVTGFALLRRGRVRLYSPQFTDWPS